MAGAEAGSDAPKAPEKTPEKAAEKTAGKAPGKAQAPAQPQFYRTPEPLNSVKHADLGIAEQTDYGFAAGATSVLVTAPEIALAARTYPIVFTDTEVPTPVAVLGVQQGKNLFVSDGKWEPRAYVPAYIRRYPFAFVEQADRKRLLLCVDTASPMVTRDTPQKFFEDGKESALTTRALEFCRNFQAHYDVTLKLGRMLRENDLLAKRRADIRLGNKDRTAVRDFLVIDEPKLAKMTDQKFLAFRKAGTLAFLYFHLMSLANFRDLALRG